MIIRIAMFDRPTITSLRDQAVNSMLTVLGLPTLLRKSVLRAMAYAVAGAAHGLYGYLDRIARQAVPFTATGLFLEAWASLVGITRKPATSATGLALFAGTVGTPIPAATKLRALGGGEYVTTADGELDANGAASVPIRATTAGPAYTLTDGTPLSLATTIPYVQTALTADHVAPGTDIELDDALRTRMLLRWASPPQGGAATDYLGWALAVPGVTRAWCLPNAYGPGSVIIYTMWDVANAAWAGFPQGSDGAAAAELREDAAQGDQLAVADAIYPLRPVTALVYSVAPLPNLIPFTVLTRTLVPASVKALAGVALTAVFTASADPLGGVLDVSPFETALADVAGMPRFTVTAPASEFSAPVGSLPTLGTITWSVAGG